MREDALEDALSSSGSEETGGSDSLSEGASCDVPPEDTPPEETGSSASPGVPDEAGSMAEPPASDCGSCSGSDAGSDSGSSFGFSLRGGRGIGWPAEEEEELQ